MLVGSNKEEEKKRREEEKKRRHWCVQTLVQMEDQDRIAPGD
jgi:hypothetical protein